MCPKLGLTVPMEACDPMLCPKSGPAHRMLIGGQLAHRYRVSELGGGQAITKTLTELFSLADRLPGLAEIEREAGGLVRGKMCDLNPTKV